MIIFGICIYAATIRDVANNAVDALKQELDLQIVFGKFMEDPTVLTIDKCRRHQDKSSVSSAHDFDVSILHKAQKNLKKLMALLESQNPGEGSRISSFLDQRNVCFQCKLESPTGLKKCGLCGERHYCSRSCASYDWENGHRVSCSRFSIRGAMIEKGWSKSDAGQLVETMDKLIVLAETRNA